MFGESMAIPWVWPWHPALGLGPVTYQITRDRALIGIIVDGRAMSICLPAFRRGVCSLELAMSRRRGRITRHASRFRTARRREP